MAEQLIEAMTAEFDPSVYPRRLSQALLKLIEDKFGCRPEDGRTGGAQPATHIYVDLMAALEASVKAAVEASRPDRADVRRGARRRS